MVFSKKAQVSVFIILGLVILLTSTIALYVKYIYSEPVKRSGLFPTGYEPQSLKLFVESCIKDVVIEPLNRIIEQGGSLDLEEDELIWYNNERFRLWCFNEQSGCSNRLTFRQDLEQELSQAIYQKLPSCANFSVFERQGYAVDAGELKVKAILGLSDITFTIDWPVSITKPDFSTDVPSFSANIESPLGGMFVLASHIVNAEIANNFFDKDSWMIDNGVFFTIQKHRPYPHLVYTIEKPNEDSVFHFALQGQDSVSLLPNYELPQESNGCCYNRYDNSCFKNAPESVCQQKGGSYDPSPFCVCQDTPELSDELCNGKPCKPCSATYTYTTNQNSGPSREHGESWCAYDSVVQSVVQNPGLAYVGSRSYLLVPEIKGRKTGNKADTQLI